MGPSEKSLDGMVHSTNGVDHATGWGEAVPIRTKGEHDKFIVQWILRNRELRMVRADGGFRGGAFERRCVTERIALDIVAPYEHHRNGAVHKEEVGGGEVVPQGTGRRD